MYMLYIKICSSEGQKAKDAQPKEVRLFIQLFLHEKTDNGDFEYSDGTTKEEDKRALK